MLKNLDFQHLKLTHDGRTDTTSYKDAQSHLRNGKGDYRSNPDDPYRVKNEKP